MFIDDHDDWDCLDDLERAGLLTTPTLTSPLVTITPRGRAVAHELQEFKAAGGDCCDFVPSADALAVDNDQ